jgi:NhaP-type Na+/H+ or K+/H+ antiporter
VTTTQLIALTIGASGVIPSFATRLRVPPPVALLVAGIAVALIPGVPELQLDPLVVILVLLPPVVYAATLRSSIRRLAHIADWALVPAVLLIVVPMLAVALASHAIIDGLAWSSAIVLGGVATASGAELLSAVDARLGLPRRLITRLRAEAAVMPLVLLPVLVLAIEAGVDESFALGNGVSSYLYDVLGGLALGTGVGLAGVWVRRSTQDGPPQIAVSFALPFLAALAGYAADASAIAAVIAAGFAVEAFYSGRALTRSYSPGTQELGRAFWIEGTLLLTGALAFIVGLSIPAAIDDVDVAAAPMAIHVAGALALVTVVRFAIGFLTAGRGRDADRVSRGAEGLLLAWGAARTPLAFVIALLIPPTVASGAPYPIAS